MTETLHARSRRAALFGLVLQVIAAVAAMALAIGVKSIGLQNLAWYLAGMAPIWFIALLVFRQHELAALEQLDLEELRREKAATGGGEALFGEAGGLGFLVAKARLDWMRRWLVPAFGLIVATYLIVIGALLWLSLRNLTSDPAIDKWPVLENTEIGLVILVLLTLMLFFYSRYASGMGRVREWQLLRACGSAMLGNTLAALALVLAFGARLYNGWLSWEHAVAWSIPVLMVLLGAETLLNFILDVYRPRSPGTEPRASFDSRLLGLISEPGGIAHSMAEAMNYQFGFQVSQTWFYQLLQRTVLVLVLVGAAAVWLLSCMVIVQPYERVIIERWGRQVDPEHPLEPGIYFKLPWPWDVAHKYNVGELHEFAVGYKVGDVPIHDPKEWLRGPPIELWTDPKHSGREHFNFVVPPAVIEGREEAASRPTAEGSQKRVPVNLIRLEAFVQYRLVPEKLALFTGSAADPHQMIRDAAWESLCQYVAGIDVLSLMGEQRHTLEHALRERITQRIQALQLGVEVVYVGLTNIHPEKSVAEAFRRVITAQQEKIREIRGARVEEDKTLAQVGGDPSRARALAQAVAHVQSAELSRTRSEQALRGDDERVRAAQERLQALLPQRTARIEAAWRLEQARREQERVKGEFDLGMGRSVREVARVDERVQQAQAALDEATRALDAALAPLRDELAPALDKGQWEAALSQAAARAELDYWHGVLERTLLGLEGQAAERLAQAQAVRWQKEMKAQGELTRLENERRAFAAAPTVYKARRYLQVLTDGIKDARKYFLAFEPGDDTKVHVRIQAEETARPSDLNLPTKERTP